VDFDVWLDDLQLFLQCDSKDGLSLFDLTFGASTAPAADADSTVRSQWLTRNAAARLAVRSHLPSTERTHFSQYKSAKTLYDAVVARYSSPATAALSRLMLPYLFPDLAAFATVTDLITYLRTSDTRYSAEDLFLSLCPTTLTVDLLEERLLAAETSITTVGASRGDPLRGAATARASGARALKEVVGEAVVAVEAEEGVGVGVMVEVGASVAAVEVETAVAVAVGVKEAKAEAAEVELVEAELCSGDPSTSHTLVRPRHPSSFVSGDRTGEQCGGQHATQRCFGRLTDAWRTQFPDATEIPRWGDLLKSGVAIFDLDFDAILVAMYAVSISAEGNCYMCVPPDLGIEAAALGARESAAPGASESAALGAGESALSGTASAQVLHTFTLDSGASRCFFRDRTTLTLLSHPVAVSMADPSGGPVLARYSTVLPCPAAPSGSLSGLYLPSFSTNLVAASSQVFAAASRSGPESAPCSCRLLSHQTLLWHHRLGHPSLPRLRGMASRVLVSGLPRSLPPLPPGPAPTCIPCVKGRQRAAPHSSEFPPTEAPLQTLHMDVKGEVTEVLIDWIRVARLQLRERFGSDFPVQRLHSDRGGEFSSDLLRAFCRAEGIRQTFTLPASPQQNGIAERRIGMVMDVALRNASDQPSAPGLPARDLPYSAVDGEDAVELVEVAVDSGASGRAEPERAEPGGAGSGGAEPERAEPGGAETRGAEPGDAESLGAEPANAGPGGPSGALSRRELELREWFARHWSRASEAGGAAGAGGSAAAGGAVGATGPGGARTGGPGAAGPGGAPGTGATGGAGAGGAAGVGATGGTGAGAVVTAGGHTGAGAAGGTGAGGAAG
ncbi:unnamed protein product, partial [Closterium sp. NIES-53]